MDAPQGNFPPISLLGKSIYSTPPHHTWAYMYIYMYYACETEVVMFSCVGAN